MEESKFETMRKDLYGKMQLGECNSINFNNDFFKLIELCTLSLMNEDDSFFGLFLIQFKREIDFKLQEAIGTKLSGTYFTMYFNPNIFLECTLKEMQALIKHEIYHIMSKHYARARVLKNKYSQLAINLAMDISVNQYLMYLPAWSVKLENVRLAYNVELNEDQTMEQYASKIQKALDKRIKNSDEFQKDFSKIHEMWNDMDENVYIDQMDEIVKKTAANAYRGKIPESIDILMKALNKAPEISWRDYLRRMIGTLPAGHRKTVTRKNRRQPERFDLKGTLSDRIVQILIAIDISGSITDSEIENSMKEVFSIVKNYPFDISIIECDSEIRRIYKVKNIKDIKEKINTKGGTKFSPVFKYIYEKKLRNYVLIFFTDGLGEKVLKVQPYNYKTIWVLTGREQNLSVEKEYGVVVKLNNSMDKKEAANGYDLIREAMRDVRSEWAK